MSTTSPCARKAATTETIGPLLPGSLPVCRARYHRLISCVKITKDMFFLQPVFSPVEPHIQNCRSRLRYPSTSLRTGWIASARSPVVCALASAKPLLRRSPDRLSHHHQRDMKIFPTVVNVVEYAKKCFR